MALWYSLSITKLGLVTFSVMPIALATCFTNANLEQIASFEAQEQEEQSNSSSDNSNATTGNLGDTVSGISTRVGALETTVGADDAHGLRQKIAELNTNKASVSTVNSLLSVVYPNSNTAQTSYIQTYALPAYYIAWENKTAIENLKTSGISATRMVDADGNGILVFKSLSTS